MAALVNLETRISRLSDPLSEANVVDLQDERTIVRLIRLLGTRIQKRDLLQEDVCKKQNHFRNVLVKLEHENAFLRHDNNEQKKIISTLEGRICKLQNHIDDLLCKLNNACDAMRNIQEELKDRDRQLQQHVLEKEKLIQRCNIMIEVETDKMTAEMETKLREQRERLTSCIKKKDDKLKLVRQILTSAREDTSDNITLTPPIASSSRVETAEKSTLMIPKKEPSLMSINLQTSKSPFGQIRQISSHARTIPNDTHGKVVGEPNSLSNEKSAVTFVDSQTSSPRSQIRQVPFHARPNSDDVQEQAAKEPILMTVAESSTSSDLKTEIVEKPNSTMPLDCPLSSTSVDNTIVNKINFSIKDKIPVVNPRYQRVQNTDRWIDHRPHGIVPTGTILQPQTQPHQRTIRKLTKPKDFLAGSSKYCLLSQEQDADGELETKLYKADVLPTCGGGAQIVFNDIECLRQISPTAAKRNGQKLENNPTHNPCGKTFDK
ncbi:PREDICTED: kinesin-like protein KIF23 isoform X2 [Wasmannia auropunctata]|uniref:kinesin-like protein KIF23 isoform X2 n=1 Tax=Wasmannia auropunctata TaxID=64793 RepID=UPI0005ED8929|nr:PREDICTED: kinesin-like protein KIF23 isoform X2 [Wasmannia auropunctata]